MKGLPNQPGGHTYNAAAAAMMVSRSQRWAGTSSNRRCQPIALRNRRLDRKLAYLDGVGAAEFLGKFAPENGDEIGLNQDGARRQIRHIQSGGRAVVQLQGLGEKLEILSARTDAKMWCLRKHIDRQLSPQGRVTAPERRHIMVIDQRVRGKAFAGEFQS